MHCNRLSLRGSLEGAQAPKSSLQTWEKTPFCVSCPQFVVLHYCGPKELVHPAVQVPFPGHIDRRRIYFPVPLYSQGRGFVWIPAKMVCTRPIPGNQISFTALQVFSVKAAGPQDGRVLPPWRCPCKQGQGKPPDLPRTVTRASNEILLT